MNIFEKIIEDIAQVYIDALNEQKAKEEAIEVFEVKRELPAEGIDISETEKEKQDDVNI